MKQSKMNRAIKRNQDYWGGCVKAGDIKKNENWIRGIQQ